MASITERETQQVEQANASGKTAVVFILKRFVQVDQGARSATISESMGRASMFLAAVSGGLVALGLVATASEVGTACYAFGLLLLPTLAFVGLVTFERVLQFGVEDYGYARRIALVHGRRDHGGACRTPLAEFADEGES